MPALPIQPQISSLYHSSATPPPLTMEEDERRIANRFVTSPTDGYLVCTLCDKRFWSMDFASDHLATTKHKTALKTAIWSEFVADPSNATMGNESQGIPDVVECRGDAWFRCTLCDCQLWCFESVRDHCMGKNHRMRLMKGSKSAESATVPEEPVERPIFAGSSYQQSTRCIPPPPSRAPLPELPAGFAHDGSSQIACTLCDIRLKSVLEAWNHSVSDYMHLRNLQIKIRFLFEQKYLVSKHIYCELCETDILDAAHFNTHKHKSMIDKLEKLNISYFQPFRDGSTIQLFSWTHGCVLTDVSIPPKQLVSNNPQLLLNQWELIRGSLPMLEWPITCAPANIIQQMLDSIHSRP